MACPRRMETVATRISGLDALRRPGMTCGKRRAPALSLLAQENVVRAVGHAACRARPVAAVLQDAADGVDPLHRDDVVELAAAFMRRGLELQPGDVVRRLAGGVACSLADHGAAVL